MATAITFLDAGIGFAGRGSPRLFRTAVVVPVALAHAALLILAARGIALSPPPVTEPEPIVVQWVEVVTPAAPVPQPEPVTPEVRPMTRPIEPAIHRAKSPPRPAETAAAPAPDALAPAPLASNAPAADAPHPIAAQSADDAPVASPPRADAAYLSNPAPEYPAAAKRSRQQGRVVLRVLVAADGAAREVALEQGCGFPLLDDAAAAAVSHWRFVPGRRGDAAVEDWVLIPISFKLRA